MKSRGGSGWKKLRRIYYLATRAIFEKADGMLDDAQSETTAFLATPSKTPLFPLRFSIRELGPADPESAWS